MLSQINSKRPSVVQRIVDRLVPNNCHTQLKEAAEENRQVREEAICMLQTAGREIKNRIRHHAA